jgi:hypothetical protein
VEAGAVTTSEWLPNVLVGITVAVQAVLLAVLVKKNRRADLPIFFLYNLFAAGSAVILLVANGRLSNTHYFNLFWSINGLVAIIEFGVMYEIFVRALRPYSGLIDLGKMLFRWAVAFLFVAATLTAFATQDTMIAKCIAAIVLLDRALRLMQCGLLLLFFLFERRLGLAWRSHTVCVALGLGVYAALSLSSSYLHTRFMPWNFALDVFDYVQYLGMVAFWAVCFYLPEPERSNVLDSPSKLIFQRWNDVLVASRFSTAPASIGTLDSFLPNVEQTVDRVLARKMVQ